MSERPRILIIDDDVDLLSVYTLVLTREGYKVSTAESAEAAKEALDAQAWDVVILDLRLQGPSGGDGGLQVLKDVALRSPGAKTILISGYASPASIDVAFSEGAYDVIEKSTPNFHTLLKAKVRNALELVQERRLAQLTDSGREALIHKLHQELDAQPDTHSKGRALEELLRLLFQSIPGFQRLESNLTNGIEEIDLVIQNESEDPFWRQERSQYILAECKNWSAPVDRVELDAFRAKIGRRFGRSRLGFLIAPGGFTSALLEVLKAGQERDLLVVPVNGSDLAELVHSIDRNAVLRDLHQRAVLAANGSLKR